ncbi:MAG: sigma-54-dependent Fis family transcriptional regulator [Candidatus Goldbacteria bacterium]|nr:sigma-54-dependent Fis family transcriptional regulator [Candidatus Goldiibacteriota bacterium]
MKKILIALKDKDESIRINNFLDDVRYSVNIINDPALFMNTISTKEYDTLIIDIQFLEMSELNIIKFLKERYENINVIVITSKELVDRAITFAQNMHFNYIISPINLNELKFIIDSIEKNIDKSSEDNYFTNRFIGKSEKIKKILNTIHKISKSDSNILITGETGTGKELIARSVYELSPRANNAFITVNSAAIPENLLESELFGYKKGAFTGATADKKGLIELADNGTLFLDEIGDISLNLQSKLLRVIEYGELRRLGDETLRNVNIRVIAATNQDLFKMIKEKKFREDLFFRLNVIHIHIPPLRERREDIPLLIRYYIERYNKETGRNIISIEPRARGILMNYDYPGNVREIDNIIQHAFAMSDSDVIKLEDLPVYLQNITPFQRLEEHNESQENSSENKQFSLAELEKQAIIKAFNKFGSNHTKVAQALGISRSTLWRKMKEYNIKDIN